MFPRVRSLEWLVETAGDDKGEAGAVALFRVGFCALGLEGEEEDDVDESAGESQCYPDINPKCEIQSEPRKGRVGLCLEGYVQKGCPAVIFEYISI